MTDGLKYSLVAVSVLIALWLISLLIGRMVDQSTRLREADERYRRFFERSLSGIYQTTLDGRLLDCNAAFARILGYATAEECLSKPMADHYSAAGDRSEFVARLMNEDSMSGFESKLKGRDGHRSGSSRRQRYSRAA